MSDIKLYTQVIWLLAFVIALLILFLCYLKIAKDRAIARESQSFIYSHLAIEGMEIERQRISRELHDTVLPRVHDSAVYDLIRTVCFELMPPDFSRLSLKDALATACDKFAKKTNIECICSIEKEVDFSKISADVQLHLYRIAQEAFNNIEKHSQAKKAVLVVRREQENIFICISDDGIGVTINETGEFPEGFGIRNIRQRAKIIGAKVDFISEAENGLMMTVELGRNEG